jgi:hypothetical protein
MLTRAGDNVSSVGPIGSIYVAAGGRVVIAPPRCPTSTVGSLLSKA